MAFEPEMFYPEYYPKLGSFEGGGMSYYPIYENASSFTQVIRTGTVEQVRFEGFDPDVHTAQNPYLKIILNFKNNVDLRLKVWASQQTIGNTLHTYIDGEAYIQYNGVETKVSWFPGCSIVSGQIAGWWTGRDTIQYMPASLAESVGIQITLFTTYPQATVIPDVTKVDSLVITSWCPTVVVDRYTGQGEFIFNPNRSSETLYNIEYGTANYWEYVTYGAFDSNPPYFPITERPIISIENLETFTEGIINLHDDGSISDMEDIAGNPITEGDPVQEQDPSGTGGGGGNYDDTSDPIDFPELPNGGALESGAIKAFIVTPAILRSMFSTLWDINVFDILLQWQKLVDNPIDAIVSLHCIPVTPENSGILGDIILGSFDTGANGVVIDSQYLTIDCGTLNVNEYWGSALDYNPYTKAEIYLPFIGIKELDIDDVMKSTLHIKYNIDILTGDCLANLKCGMSVLYKFNGNLKQDVPLTGRVNDTMFKILQSAGIYAGAEMMGTAVGGPVGAAIAGGGALSAASNVLSSKVTTSRSGNLGGAVGLLDDFRPYLILHRPVQSLAKDFKKFKGYPSNITATLSSLKGYTEVEFINLQNIPNATSAEMDEIKSLLSSGVLL